MMEIILKAMPAPVINNTATLLRPNASSRKKYSDRISMSRIIKKGKIDFLLIVNRDC
jgi:hypothetical protein